MKIHFNGAARTVTGSQFLLEINGARLLLECGLFQGRRKDTYSRNLNFPFKPKKLDAVLLSHAHIDHSGNIPNLFKNGYSGPVYATRPTAKLADIMLRDSGHIQESDVKYVNKKRSKKNLPPINPLYTIEDAERAALFFKPIDYDQSFEPVPGVTAMFVEAGHILGSAAIVLDINENGRKFRVWFSGDIGRYELPLLRDPVLPENVDYLIMESTYGDTNKRSPVAAYEEFCQVADKTLRQKQGKVIIPAFAVGRTQELVYQLNRMISERDIPRIPVYVDSPLAINATDIFRAFPECFDAETKEFVRKGKHPALKFDGIHYTRSVKESKAINEYKGPAVIISASGMAEAGRILHHLRNNIEKKRNTIMIVSWQAPHTLGRRLAERKKNIKIFGESFHRRAEVATIGGLSAHAGQDLLLDYALASKAQLKKVFLVHGEDRGALPLQEKMVQAGLKDVIYPEQLETIEI
ncbi:MAG: MBL fold metallo-hydrolase [Anaerolineaceae bacterium]|nr:MBL fold metallo-hydrolase [Anaerolineaceae bacterium]